MNMKIPPIILGIIFIIVLSGCSNAPKCGDGICSDSERTFRLDSSIEECSSNHCFQDCGVCYTARTDEFVAKRTIEQYKGLQQSFSDPLGAACLYDNNVRNHVNGICKGISVLQDSNGDYFISCKCNWDEEHRYS